MITENTPPSLLRALVFPPCELLGILCTTFWPFLFAPPCEISLYTCLTQHASKTQVDAYDCCGSCLHSSPQARSLAHNFQLPRSPQTLISMSLFPWGQQALRDAPHLHLWPPGKKLGGVESPVVFPVLSWITAPCYLSSKLRKQLFHTFSSVSDQGRLRPFLLTPSWLEAELFALDFKLQLLFFLIFIGCSRDYTMHLHLSLSSQILYWITSRKM